jgi:hypothetical protein
MVRIRGTMDVFEEISELSKFWSSFFLHPFPSLNTREIKHPGPLSIWKSTLHQRGSSRPSYLFNPVLPYWLSFATKKASWLQHSSLQLLHAIRSGMVTRISPFDESVILFLPSNQIVLCLRNLKSVFEFWSKISPYVVFQWPQLLLGLSAKDAHIFVGNPRKMSPCLVFKVSGVSFRILVKNIWNSQFSSNLSSAESQQRLSTSMQLISWTINRLIVHENPLERRRSPLHLFHSTLGMNPIAVVPDCYSQSSQIQHQYQDFLFLGLVGKSSLVTCPIASEVYDYHCCIVMIEKLASRSCQLAPKLLLSM